MNNIIGILVSIVFVFLIIIIASFMKNLGILSMEGSRKFIHIGVSNWCIISMIFFDNNISAAVVPGFFVIINYISYTKQLFSAMERNESKKDLGTVYYALSLLILSLITFKDKELSYIGALGILIMGYGDGFAAIVGINFGKHKFKIFGNYKSIEGSLAMFTFSFIVSIIILYIFNPNNILLFSFILAALSTILELFSPFGLDNLTVPLGSAIFFYTILLQV
ncbi:diacylglycerol/polyprenol kinase family protein [Tissierella pigra]|uniref:Phosphatidate cytidylyltransferase n=1 Tax=Tissierella pigra TaxID=2607614 RepID=A0A6N7XDV0_9FIRM|nr:phosphatidate cytidylyltransferase [Tissierella pigra]MSU00231.1 phosphatidate cytidylyltransferase [Tissierella pigra]